MKYYMSEILHFSKGGYSQAANKSKKREFSLGKEMPFPLV